MRSPFALLLLLAFAAVAGGRVASAGPYSMSRVAFASGPTGSSASGYSLTGGAGQALVQLAAGGAYSFQLGFWALPGPGTTDVLEPPPPLANGRLRNSPNPFASRADVSFEIASAQRVSLEVFDLRGARVRTLLDRHLEPGRYHVPWDGRDEAGASAPAGVYWVQFLASGGTRERGRIIRLP